MLNLARFHKPAHIAWPENQRMKECVWSARRLGPSLKYLGFSVLPGFEREREIDVERIRTLGFSFFFFLFFSKGLEASLERGWKSGGNFFKMARKMMVFDQSRKVHAFSRIFPFLLRLQNIDAPKYRGVERRKGAKKILRLRGNGIRSKQKEETIFNVSVKFHEILNFEYLYIRWSWRLSYYTVSRRSRNRY